MGHLSDETLIRAIDTELAAKRARDVEAHLAECETCRHRSQQLYAVSARLTVANRNDEEGALMTAALRARLTGALAAEPAPRSAVRLSSAAMAAAVLVVAAVLGRALTPWPGVDALTTPIEPAARPIGPITPGAVEAVSVTELCAGRLPHREQVPADVRQAILHDYHMEAVSADEYELDYLITPELGGSSDRRNLWPERYGSRVWNARVKDDLERLLPQLVCAGSLDLATAQRDIALDWIAAYQKYFHTERPIETRAALDEDAVPSTPDPWQQRANH
jgi:hypothetical protein